MSDTTTTAAAPPEGSEEAAPTTNEASSRQREDAIVPDEVLSIHASGHFNDQDDNEDRLVLTSTAVQDANRSTATLEDIGRVKSMGIHGVTPNNGGVLLVEPRVMRNVCSTLAKPTCCLEQLCFSSIDISAHAQEVSVALASNSSLRKLSFRTCRFKLESIQSICSGLEQHSGLKKLELTDCSGIRNSGAQVIADTILSPDAAISVNSLLVRNCGMGTNGVNGILQALPGNAALRVLNLSGNQCNGSIAPAMARALRAASLKSLSLCGCFNRWIPPTGNPERIITTSSLESLYLNGNAALRDREVSFIAEWLINSGNRQFKRLYLNICGIGEVGARALARAVEKCTNLQVLSLTLNFNMGRAGVVALVTAVQRNTTLLELNLDHIRSADADWELRRSLSNYLRGNRALERRRQHFPTSCDLLPPEALRLYFAQLDNHPAVLYQELKTIDFTKLWSRKRCRAEGTPWAGATADRFF